MCGSPGKHPHARMARHGLKDATTDVGVIKTWFAEHYWLNYGIVTDTLPTIDIDPRNGGDKAWRELLGTTRPDIHTWRVVTGGGGQHIICSTTATPVVSGKLARGVDVKGVGGYIVGVGSLHLNGKRYRWFPQCSPKTFPIRLSRRFRCRHGFSTSSARNRNGTAKHARQNITAN